MRWSGRGLIGSGSRTAARWSRCAPRSRTWRLSPTAPLIAFCATNSERVGDQAHGEEGEFEGHLRTSTSERPRPTRLVGVVVPLRRRTLSAWKQFPPFLDDLIWERGPLTRWTGKDVPYRKTITEFHESDRRWCWCRSISAFASLKEAARCWPKMPWIQQLVMRDG